MLKNVFLFASLFIFSGWAQAKLEHISVHMLVSGDLKGEYDFSGPLGAEITASSDISDPVCNFSSLFRKVKYRTKNSVEAWIKLDCTFEGQKSTYKIHRIYLSLDQTQQKVRLPMLAKNLKNVQLEFQELSLKSSK